MKPDVRLNDVYESAYKVISAEKDKSWIDEHLSSDFGYGTGYKHSDSSLTISHDNENKVKAGNTFFV